MFIIKVKKTCFYVFYLQINVFNIYVSDIYDRNTVPDLIPAISSITRGHIIKKLFKPYSSKNVRQKLFTVRTIDIWNSLSYEVVNAPTVNTFKNRLDRHWANQEVLCVYRATINTGTWKL